MHRRTLALGEDATAEEPLFGRSVPELRVFSVAPRRATGGPLIVGTDNGPAKG